MMTLYFAAVVSFFFLSFFLLAYCQQSEIGCPPYFHTWCGHSVNLECRSEMCCIWLAESTGCKKLRKCCHLHIISVQLCQAVSSLLKNVSTIVKNLLNSNIFPHMCSQYVELRCTNGWDQFCLGHPSKFKWILRLGFDTAAISLKGGQPNFAQSLAISSAGTLYIYIFGGSCHLMEFCLVQK